MFELSQRGTSNVPPFSASFRQLVEGRLAVGEQLDEVRRLPRSRAGTVVVPGAVGGVLAGDQAQREVLDQLLVLRVVEAVQEQDRQRALVGVVAVAQLGGVFADVVRRPWTTGSPPGTPHSSRVSPGSDAKPTERPPTPIEGTLSPQVPPGWMCCFRYQTPLAMALLVLRSSSAPAGSDATGGGAGGAAGGGRPGRRGGAGGAARRTGVEAVDRQAGSAEQVEQARRRGRRPAGTVRPTTGRGWRHWSGLPEEGAALETRDGIARRHPVHRLQRHHSWDRQRRWLGNDEALGWRDINGRRTVRA